MSRLRRSRRRRPYPVVLASVMLAVVAGQLVGGPAIAGSNVPEADQVAGVQLASTTTHTSGHVQFEIYSDPRPVWTPELLPTSVDVRVSHTSMLSRRMSAWDYPAAFRSVAFNGLHMPLVDASVAPGWIVCVAARPHFADGVTGQFGTPYCYGRFLDDGQLHRQGRVVRVRGKFWHGRASKVYGDRSSLTLRHVPRGSLFLTLSTTQASDGECRCASVSYPTRTGRRSEMIGSAISEHTFHSVETAFGVRTGRRGPLVFRSESEAAPSNPIEGVLVLPPWAS